MDNWATLSRTARFHGVFGYLARALRATGPALPGAVAGELRRGNAASAAHYLSAVGDLGRLAVCLDAADISWAGLKGPYLTDLAHGAVHLRTFGDLDILVRPDQVGDAVRALTSIGARLIVEDYDLIRRNQRAELHLQLPGGTQLDLHWDLVNDARRRRALSVPAARTLLSRRRQVRVDGQPRWTLDALDTALHVALHATASGGHRLVWTRDVHGSWSGLAHTAERVKAEADDWGVSLPVAMALDRVVQIGGPVPVAASSFAPLLASPWVAARRHLGALPGPNPDTTRHTAAMWLSRSTRPSIPAGIAEMVRYAWAFVDREQQRRSAASVESSAAALDGLFHVLAVRPEELSLR